MCNHSIWGLSLIHLMNWCCTIKCVYFHFQNYLHGWRECSIAYGKNERLMKLIGDQVQIFLMSSTKPPRHFWLKERKSPSPTRFGRWIRTAEQSQLPTVATTSYGLQLGRYRTFWKAYQVYFPTDLDSCRYLVKYVRSSYFNTETFSVHGAASLDCCPMGRVSSGAQ
jgi:hypothetical protein